MSAKQKMSEDSKFSIISEHIKKYGMNYPEEEKKKDKEYVWVYLEDKKNKIEKDKKNIKRIFNRL